MTSERYDCTKKMIPPKPSLVEVDELVRRGVCEVVCGDGGDAGGEGENVGLLLMVVDW